MNCLRHSIFNFLWGSVNGVSKMHLVDWHMVLRPYEYGGWDIKNLEWISLSLRLKSCWLVLQGKGIWSHIIQPKYLKDQSVEHWFRSQKFSMQGSSDPGGYWWPHTYFSWTPTTISFSFPVSLIVAKFSIFAVFGS